MTGADALAAAAGALAALAGVALLVVVLGAARGSGAWAERERQADWCEDGPVSHLRDECRHAAPTQLADRQRDAHRVTTVQALADVDAQLRVLSDMRLAWPGEEHLRLWSDQLLDERARLVAVLATA